MTVTPPPPPGPGRPTPPIPLAGDPATAPSRLPTEQVDVPEPVLQRLRQAASLVDVTPVGTAEASRDWWPMAMSWATDGDLPARAAVVVQPAATAEVAEVLAICHEVGLPVTAAAGRSGVCGASVPLHGGVVLDMTGLAGVRSVDPESLVLDVLPGTFGDHLEQELRDGHGLTLGHWPQSMSLSTVGGWLACRSAGQYSTRYGKIEDMVLGLDVVLADGRTIHTGDHPRAATGSDLTQLFVGSEGTLGIICGARFQLHPAPVAETRSAWLLPSFSHGLDALRRIIQRGAHPAALRLYDPAEADRIYHTGDQALVLVVDEGDPVMLAANATVVAEEMAADPSGPAAPAPEEHVRHWLGKRNDVAALEALVTKGYVVDTMEVAGSWTQLPDIHRAVRDALLEVDGTLAASAHQSHSYPTGGCLYFTFAGKVDPDRRDTYYREVWDAGQRTALAHGAALSHHHGVGLNRGRFMADALGSQFEVLNTVKRALDPHGILNPGKLGLPSPWGPPPDWS